MEVTSGISINCGGSVMPVRAPCECDYYCNNAPILIPLNFTKKVPQVSLINYEGDFKCGQMLTAWDATMQKITSESSDIIFQDSKSTEISAARDVFLINSEGGTVKAGRDIFFMASRVEGLEAKGDVFLYFKKTEPDSFSYVNGKVDGNLFSTHPKIYLKNFKVGEAVIFQGTKTKGTIYLDKQSSIGNIRETNGTIIRIEDGKESTSGASSSSGIGASSSSSVSSSSDPVSSGSDAMSTSSGATSSSAGQGHATGKGQKRKEGEMEETLPE